MGNVVESVGRGIERIALRTPTLPPATETNSYVIAHEGAFYVVEPATPHARERRILFEHVRHRAALGETLLGAIVTHHHGDHVGAADAFRTEFGVPLFAHPITRDRLADTVTVDRVLNDGDKLFDGAVTVLHTPGHAPGHVCLFHAVDGWLIAGDMVASVGTIIIDPDDDGDMAAYVAQLARLAELSARRLLPAHGEPVDRVQDHLGFYLAHRRERELKVLNALPRDRASANLTDIVRSAYADTPAWLWPLAAKSARAHLAKLERDGRVLLDDPTNRRWRTAD